MTRGAAEGFPPAILWMTCCSVRLLLLPGLLLRKMPRMLLAFGCWDRLSEDLFGLLDMETKPESLMTKDLPLSTGLELEK